MSMQFGPTTQGAALEPALPHHSSYDRIHEAWASSQDKGALSLRAFISSPEQPLHINCEHLAELLGDAQHDPSPFGRWIFDQAATILAEISPDASYIDNNDFSHTAKYLFVGACFSSPAQSLIDDAASGELAERLVNRAVTFCESSHSLGTMPLVIKGIIASNIRAWGATGVIESFLFKPSGLSSADFHRLLHPASEREERHAVVPASKTASFAMRMCERFCTAASPAEFLLWAFSHNVALPAPELAPILKRALAAHLGDSAKNHPCLAESLVQEIPEKRQEVSTTALEVKRGIYVDVFGTLIHHDGTPNYRLAQMVTDLMRHDPPRQVYLISDSQDEEIERALAFLDPRPTIVHKDELQGSELECLIDNCEPTPQGLHVRHYLSPEEAVAQATGLVENYIAEFPA